MWYLMCNFVHCLVIKHQCPVLENRIKEDDVATCWACGGMAAALAPVGGCESHSIPG